tara:strand:- start:1220 stop:1552 length:333 start_codon:yes stop_codon:yes gene_type:complete
MKGPYVLWDDLEIMGSSYPQQSGVKKSGWDLDNMAFVKIYLHEDEATAMRATMEAIKKFKEAVVEPANIRKTSIIEKKKIILFTSIQIEYTIEIIANSTVVKMWYDSLTE